MLGKADSLTGRAAVPHKPTDPGWRRRRRGGLVAVAAVAVVSAGCAAGAGGTTEASKGVEPQSLSRLAAPAALPAPTTTAAPTTTTTTTTAPPPRAGGSVRYVSPPTRVASNGDGSATRPWNDFCYAIGRVATGDTLVVAGSRSEPYDFDSAPTTAGVASTCHVTPTATDVLVWGTGDPLIKGQLTMASAVRWTFDGIDATRSTNMGHESMVEMIGGDGWRWTNCEMWGSQAGAEFGVGNWGGTIPPVNWKLDHCFIHDNPGHPSRGTRPSHNLYIFTADGVYSNGTIEDNVILGAPMGVNVKVGGTGNASEEGSDGITVRRNVLVNNGTGWNMCVCTDSDDVTVSNNVMVSQTDPASATHVVLGSFSGSNLQFVDNLFWGFDPAQSPARAFLWSSGTGAYVSIGLNQSSPFVAQTRSVNADPGYPALAALNSPSGFPAADVGGVHYGPG